VIEASLIALVLVVVLQPLVLRLNAIEERMRGVSRIEGKVDALLEHSGVRFDPYRDIPPAVAEAVRAGRKIEAIKHYRMATGAGLKDAKEYVEELQRRR
jgi:ribosomal protein L7/L12